MFFTFSIVLLLLFSLELLVVVVVVAVVATDLVLVTVGKSKDLRVVCPFDKRNVNFETLFIAALLCIFGIQ